jgi:hypothetical protein
MVILLISSKLNPAESIRLFKGLLHEVGVTEKDYEWLGWNPQENTVVIDNWKCSDLIIGKAFEEWGKIQGRQFSCAKCWAEQLGECFEGVCQNGNK